MTLKEAEWGWCDNCTLSLFGKGRVELAGIHPYFFSSGHNIDHIGWVPCFNKIHIYCFNKILIGPISFSDSRHKRDFGDIEWEEQTASLISSVAAGSIFHCPEYWGVKKYSKCTAKKLTNFVICHFQDSSSWKGSEGIESTRKMWLVSNSEIKAGKRKVDRETKH